MLRLLRVRSMPSYGGHIREQRGMFTLSLIHYLSQANRETVRSHENLHKGVTGR